MPAVASPLFASGRFIFQNVVKNPAPSSAAASSSDFGIAINVDFRINMDMASPMERYTSVTPQMLSYRFSFITSENSGCALDCAGTRRVMVNSAKIRFFPGNLYFAITYPPMEKIMRETPVDTVQIIREFIKYRTKSYFSKIYANASNPMLSGSANGLERICAFVLNADIITHKIGNTDTIMVKIITAYINILTPILFVFIILLLPDY